MKTKINIFGVEFTMNAVCKGDIYNVWGDHLNHYKFIVSISRNGQKTRFTYYDSFANWQNGKDELNEDDLKGAFDCFMSDAMSYECSTDFEDFCAEFGYNELSQYKQAIKAYNGCKRHSIALNRLFSKDEIQTISDHLYD